MSHICMVFSFGPYFPNNSEITKQLVRFSKELNRIDANMQKRFVLTLLCSSPSSFLLIFLDFYLTFSYWSSTFHYHSHNHFAILHSSFLFSPPCLFLLFLPVFFFTFFLLSVPFSFQYLPSFWPWAFQSSSKYLNENQWKLGS